MIVLSAGMQKSGTAWFFNITNDMLVAAGYDDVRTIREQFGLQSILLYHNCNMEDLTQEKFSQILIPHNAGYTFVVKTHRGPSPAVSSLISENIIKATYIYRDPRDVVVSVMDHGHKIRSNGENHTFAEYDSLEKAVFFVKDLLIIWENWIQFSQVFTIRYEDFLADPVSELKRLSCFLAIDVSYDKIQTILKSYQKKNLDTQSTDFLHFNKGVSGRFRSVMSSKEQDFCLEQFGDSLFKMGYPL